MKKRLESLERQTRVFRQDQTDPDLLVSEDRYTAMSAGSPLPIVGELVTKCFDHRDQVAIPVDIGEESLVFVLLNDLSPRNQKEVRALFPESDLI